MIYIDDNYNVWLITLIGASGKSANAPLLPKEKEIKTMIDLTEIHPYNYKDYDLKFVEKENKEDV